MKVAQIVTNKIICKLNKGIVPWHKPWFQFPAINNMTGNVYKGINQLILDGGEYLTFNQIKQLRGKLKKGSHAEQVIFYTETEDEEDEKIITKRIIKYYNVFNIANTEGIESKFKGEYKDNNTIENCEKIINNYLDKTGMKIKKERCKGYYAPTADIINVPNIELFDSSEHYYSTVFHEIAHSTGHQTRLNRLTATEKRSKSYAREELVAEITSAMLAEYAGISTREIFDNSAAYVSQWAQKLEEDCNAILYAAAKAEQAFNYIIEIKHMSKSKQIPVANR